MSSNSELLKRRQDAIPAGLGTMHPIFCERAENAELWDVEGNRFIDFAAGIAVTNTGHQHPRILKAVEELPDDVTLDEAIEKLCFLAKVERGLKQANEGKTVLHDEVKERLLG